MSLLIDKLELPELISSCVEVRDGQAFRCVRVTEHITLLPAYVGRIADGVVEYLNGKVLTYCSQLKGVLLLYFKPAVLQSEGKIFDEHPHIHLDISYSAYVFRPLLGSMLYGTVNKVGVDHIGCLAYDCFNVSIIVPHRTSLGGKNGISSRYKHVKEGSVVPFRVVAINTPTSGEVLTLTGELEPMKSKKRKRQRPEE